MLMLLIQWVLCPYACFIYIHESKLLLRITESICVEVTPGVSSNQSENRTTQAEGETERGRCSSECECTMLCHRATDNNQGEKAAALDIPFLGVALEIKKV